MNRGQKIKKQFPGVLGLFFAVVLVITSSSQVYAILGGHNTRGDNGLLVGTQADPGIYVPLLYLNYNADTLRDDHGDSIPFEGELKVEAISPMFLWVSEKKIMSGNYSLLVAPALTTNSLEAPLLGGTDTTNWGIGDTYIQPINIGWHLPRADFMAGLGVYAPTGDYDFGGDENNGLGMWSFEIFGGTTLYLDQARNWHFAAAAFFETHGDKEDSDVRVGNMLTVEGGIGRNFMEGAANAGISYYGQWKLSSDDIGSELSTALDTDRYPNKHQVYGIGPELTLPIATSATFYGVVNLRYLWEFGAESTSEGETFVMTFTLPIPSIPLQ